MAAPIERFTADRATIVRTYPIDISETRRKRLEQFYAEWSARLAQMNFDSLSQDGRIDYIIFKNHLQHEVQQLDLGAKSFQEEVPLIGFVGTIIGLEESRRRMGAARCAEDGGDGQHAGQADRRDAQEGGSTLRSSPPKENSGESAAVTLNNMRGTLRRWYEFYNGYDPSFTWWMWNRTNRPRH